ncbi:MAG: putative ATP-grasp-modified RiPP [Pseudonocardiaceae bacterium]
MDALAEVVDADAMDRRHFLALTGTTLMTSPAHEWLLDPGRVAVLLCGKRVDHALVDDLERVAETKRRMDNAFTTYHGGHAMNSTDPLREVMEDNPLSSGVLRYSLRPVAAADGPGPQQTRPFGLRFSRTMSVPVRQQVRYCHRLQLAVDEDGRPLIERLGSEEDQGKQWLTKAESDGDEGKEEDTWGWEEQ